MRKESLADVRQPAHMTALLEQVTDLARGVRRLTAPNRENGEDEYARLCGELDLAGNAMDDIPDRAILRRLVEGRNAPARGVHGERG